MKLRVVDGIIRTANRETPRGRRKKPNLGRSPKGRQETADVNLRIPRHVPGVLCRGLEKSFAKPHGQSMAGARYGV